MSKTSVKLITFFITFFLVFDLKVPFLGSLGSGFVSFIILLLIILFSRDMSVYNRVCLGISNYKYLLLAYFILIVLAFSRIILSGGVEPSIIMSILKSFTLIIGLIVTFSLFSEHIRPSLIFNVFLLNAVFSLIIGTFDLLMPIALFVKYAYSDIFFINYRYSFLTGFSAFGIAAPYCLAIVFSSYYISRKEKANYLDFLKLGVIILAALLAARTSFIAVFLSLLILGRYKARYLVYILPILGGLLFFILSSSHFENITHWMFELFLTGAANNSTNELQDMYFLPDPNTFIFGDAQYVTESGYYKGVDAGYMRHLLFGGIFFVLFVCIVPIIISLISRSYFFFIFVCSLTYILHFKGAVLINSSIFMATLILICEVFRKGFFARIQNVNSV